MSFFDTNAQINLIEIPKFKDELLQNDWKKEKKKEKK